MGFESCACRPFPCSFGVTLPFRPPPRGVLAGPERHRVLVVVHPAALRVAVQGAAGTVGDVAEMAQECAAVPLLDLAVELLRAADGREEVGEVNRVAAGRFPGAEYHRLTGSDLRQTAPAGQEFTARVLADPRRFQISVPPGTARQPLDDLERDLQGL